jgi:putative acetyltransferase
MSAPTQSPLQGRLTVALESPLTAESVALVNELDGYLRTLYPPEKSHLLAPDQLAQASTLFCLARLDGAAVGCGAVRFFPDYAEIKRMFVRPQARGLGISRFLLTWLEEQALRNGYSTVRLETGVRNVEAVALYEACGYQRIPVFGEYTENGVSLCYEKTLP